MQVEIWSDVVCPWCYIGKRRLERALGEFEHADEVEVTWRSFQLNPDTLPGTAVPTLEYLTRRYGPPGWPSWPRPRAWTSTPPRSR